MKFLLSMYVCVVSSRLPSVTNIRGPKGAPNPQLFPFLSRRLAASEPPETPTSDALR